MAAGRHGFRVAQLVGRQLFHQVTELLTPGVWSTYYAAYHARVVGRRASPVTALTHGRPVHTHFKAIKSGLKKRTQPFRWVQVEGCVRGHHGFDDPHGS